MGYAAEKKQAEKKVKKWKAVLAIVCVVILCALSAFSAIIPAEQWKYYTDLPTISAWEKGDLRIHFVDVGQGDATIVELPDGKKMLVDGGDATTETEYALMRYLNALGIKTIDYLLVTHVDSDHCGALDAVLKYKEVKHAFLPVAAETTNKEYAEFYAMLMREDCEREFTESGRALGVKEGVYPYTLTFLYPYGVDVEEALASGTGFPDTNKYSAVLWLEYNGASTLFTGDMPLSTEEELTFSDKMGILKGKYGIQLVGTDILKVAHHGGASSTGDNFLNHIQTQTAVISCGVDNAYGHPSMEVTQRLEDKKIKTYRTDIQGSIIATVKAGAMEYEMQTLGK